MSNPKPSKPPECSGGGQRQMLSWMPDNEGYPGAVVCLGCSGGILVLKGSVRKDVSESGFKGLSGIVRKHRMIT